MAETTLAAADNTTVDAEIALLSAVLTDTEALLSVVDTLSQGDFYDPRHGAVWAAIQSTHQAGIGIDTITISRVLRKAETLDAVGGMAYLGLLARAYHTTAMVETHAAIITERAHARRLDLMIQRCGKLIADGTAASVVEAQLADWLASQGPIGSSQDVFTVDEWLARPKAPWLITSYLPASSVAIMYGESTAGKTFIAIRMALSVAMGWHFSGQPNAETGLVMYVVGEGQGGFGSRLEAWMNHTSERITNLHLHDGPVDLSDPTAVTAFIGKCRRLPEPLKLIVFDTLAKCMPGVDENSAQETGVVLDALGMIQRATGATVLVLHHTQKADATKYRGSSAIYAGVDTAILITHEPISGIRTLRCDKMKDGQEFTDCDFELHQVGASCVMAPAGEITGKRVGGERQGRKRKALTMIQKRLLDTYAYAPAEGYSKKEARDVSDLNWSTVKDFTDALFDHGYLYIVGGSSGVGTRYRAAEDSEGRSSNSVPTPSHSVPLRPKDQPHLFEAPSQLRPDISTDAANPDGDMNNPGRSTNSVPTPSLRPTATPAGLPAVPLPLKGEVPGNPEARHDGGPPMDGLLPIRPDDPGQPPALQNPTFEDEL
jgi:hypothetical protein